MILYNVTAAVDSAIHDEWIDWMKNTHIPEVLATNRFLDCKMFRVLLSKEDELTYSIQYFAETMAELQLYEALNAETLRTKHSSRYGEQVLTFRTVLEEI